MKDKKYLTSFLFLFTGISIVAYLLFRFSSYKLIHPSFATLQAFMLVVMIVSHLVHKRGAKIGLQLHALFFITLTIRFILSIVFVLVFLHISEVSLTLFVLNFFILYLCYTWFEIYFLLRNLRADFEK